MLPAASNVDPFSQTRSFLALNIDNICVTPATAANATFLHVVPMLPVVVFLKSLILGECCLF